MRIQRNTIITLVVFIFIAALLIIFESRANFPDPDSFYHAKMATIIRDQGFIETFPWFQWTDLKNTYVNPHLLYHVLLIPFVTVFNPLVGIKISAVIFGLLAFLAIYLAARSFKAPHPWLFPLAAALSQSFIFRMSLPRAPALSVVVLIMATWAMMKKRTKTLFFVSIIFAWLYHGWPIIFLSLGALFVADFLTSTINREKSFWHLFKKTISRQKENIAATSAGILAGMVINPYFPENIAFSVLDIFKIGVVNYQSLLPVGQEWFPISLGGFLTGCFPALLVTGLTLAFFVPGLISNKKIPPFDQTVSIFTFLFLAGGYSVLCFKANRYVEYAVPFMVLEAAVLMPFTISFWQQELWPVLNEVLKKGRIKKIAIITLLSITILGLAAGAIQTTTGSNDYYQAKQYEPATEWIKNHVPAGENVFHNSWDYSLILWYLDDTHYYLAGLDPTFMYDYNKEDYESWWKLSTGEDKDVSKIIYLFKARVVIIDKRFGTAETFGKNLITSGLFEKVVENEWLEVYADTTL
ncbi:MAG: hypothetical protein WC702_03255 [Patescibacteria group bacterium]|jgi:hypothetical protein